MAPQRKQTKEKKDASATAATTTTRATRSATRTTTRATRSATRRGDAALNPPVANPEPRKRKKAKTTTTASSSAAAKTVIIEHCKQCNSFKTRAIQVKNGLEKGVAGISVVINPEKPRKGCFEIREEGGDTFVSLLDMERPFEPLKALDMDKVVSDIVERIK